MVKNIDKFGYYGGIRLLQATIKRFKKFYDSNELILGTENFSIRYFSNIPIRVGMARSSAIITSALRALMQFYQVGISKHTLANLALSVESDDLGNKLDFIKSNLHYALRCPDMRVELEIFMRRHLALSHDQSAS